MLMDVFLKDDLVCGVEKVSRGKSESHWGPFQRQMRDAAAWPTVAAVEKNIVDAEWAALADELAVGRVGEKARG